MTPVYQTRAAAGGKTGDCFPACIASLLDLSLGSLPDFNAAFSPGAEISMVELDAMNEWFASVGLVYVEFAFAMRRDDLLNQMDKMNPGLKYVLIGCARSGVPHAVVAGHGRVLHDPGGARPGTDSVPFPCRDGYYRVGVMAKKL